MAQRCPGQPDHPAHEVLQGFAQNFDGETVWLTELASEYPEGLCDNLAGAYAADLRANPARREVQRVT
eukprot:11661832-Heterocapsa_arctica.AAC.1